MLELLWNGGPLTWGVILWALVLYSAIFREIGLRRERFAPALWSGLVAMVLLGLFGTTAGFISARGVPPELLGDVASIAVIPFCIATVAGVPAALLIGVSLTLRVEPAHKR